MEQRPHVSPRTIRIALVLLIVIALVVLAWSTQPGLRQKDGQAVIIAGQQVDLTAETATPTQTPTLLPPGTPTDTVVPISLNTDSGQKTINTEGVLLLAMRDGQFSHLFAYHPLFLPLTRITSNPWDDITPALSPDGTRLAYSSRQNGYWDLYILDLTTGQQTRLTDTPDYEASPSWSPDGLWIAFERFNGANLDIYILPINEPETDPIQLTDDPGIDRSPAWAPQGREIAFVSTRSGEEEIWLARLDNINDRFVNVSRSPLAYDRFPVWTGDGQQLGWASERGSERSSGDRRLGIWERNHFDRPARLIGEGDLVAWSPDSQYLFSTVRGPNQTNLTAFSAADGRQALPLTALPGTINGMSWVPGPLPEWLNQAVQKSAAAPIPTLWEPILTRTVEPSGRKSVVNIEDVSAPFSLLHDGVDESFNGLRRQISEESGWDTLSNLENAYIPITTPNLPSIQQDWLYTGRAFAINPLLLSGGWMTIVREDFGGQTYWRVFVKARYQDGSMGMPIPAMIWDLNARFSGDPKAYELGGRVTQPPPGYWIDLTELASRYGWERLPAWINWRTFYPSIRFNQFVITGGLDWYQAMTELYPPEAMVTSTPLPTKTPAVLFATSTPDPKQPTKTATPTVTPYPTRRPTWTPLAPQQSP